MSRLFADPPTITVDADGDGVPLYFVWDDTTHPIDRVVDQWVVDSEWWSKRIWRSYFRLTTTTGMLVEIYRDLLSQEWAVQRLYD